MNATDAYEPDGQTMMARPRMDRVPYPMEKGINLWIGDPRVDRRDGVGWVKQISWATMSPLYRQW